MKPTLVTALGDGPYFGGARVCLVDAAFAPVFRYFDVFDGLGDFGVFTRTPRLSAWREALRERPSVKRAVGPDDATLLLEFLRAKDAHVLVRQQH